MKPIHIIAGLGATLIVGLAGWYMYMQQTPSYERTYQRGLPPGVAAKAAPEDPAKPTPAAARAMAASDATAPPADAAADAAADAEADLGEPGDGDGDGEP